jgi:hypothetical protein
LRKENKGASINKENNSNENNLNINSNKKNGKILNFTIEKKYKDKIIDEKNYKNFKNEISNLDILKKNLEYSEKDKNKIKENELNNYKNLKTNNLLTNIDYHQKLNGNMRQEVDCKAQHFLGEDLMLKTIEAVSWQTLNH